MTGPRIATLLAATGALAGCVTTMYTSASPAVSTRPAMKMTQTDFVIRVVDYACELPGCRAVGHRNANLGTPGVRETIRDMCWVHADVGAPSERGPLTAACFEKATMSVGDPGLSQIWQACVAANENDFKVRCYAAALSDLIKAGADMPITSMIPGALTDQPAVAAAPAASPSGQLAASCVEWAAVIEACVPGKEGQTHARLVMHLTEAACAEQMPRFRRSRGACADKVPSSAPAVAAAPAIGRPVGQAGKGMFLSAGAVDARLANGILVTDCVKGSGPHRAGLRPGDLVTSVNGAPATVAGWRKAHVEAGLGGTLRATIKHNGQTEELEWTIARCDHPSCACGADMLCSRKGDALPRQTMGLLIKENRVEQALEGPGAAAGLQAGDEILRINEIPVRDVQSVVEIVAQLELGATANVVYARAGKEAKVAVKLAATP